MIFQKWERKSCSCWKLLQQWRCSWWKDGYIPHFHYKIWNSILVHCFCFCLLDIWINEIHIWIAKKKQWRVAFNIYFIQDSFCLASKNSLSLMQQNTLFLSLLEVNLLFMQRQKPEFFAKWSFTQTIKVLIPNFHHIVDNFHLFPQCLYHTSHQSSLGYSNFHTDHSDELWHFH